MRATEEMVKTASKVIAGFCPELSKDTCLVFATKLLDTVLENYELDENNMLTPRKD